MHRYKNQNSGVTHYFNGKDYIEIKFKNKSGGYTYNYALNGKKHIDALKKLAVKGKGLNTYISQHPEVKNHFIRW
jgi:hypothetical protein